MHMSTLNVHYRSCCPLLPAVCIVCIVTVQERSRRGGRRERWGRRQLCSSDDHAPPRSNMLYTCDPDHAEQEPRCNENQADYKLPCCDLCATRPAGCHRDERLRSSSVTCRSSVTRTRAALSILKFTSCLVDQLQLYLLAHGRTLEKRDFSVRICIEYMSR